MKLSTTVFNFPSASSVAACACHDREAMFSIGNEVFTGQFDGSIATRVGETTVDSRGFPTVPLTIIGYSTTSKVKNMGKTTLDFDFSRTTNVSRLTGNTKNKIFPGTQQMNLRILMTSDAFPGKTLRSKTIGTLVNDKAQAFPPPPGSIYKLQRAVGLEDIDNPGKVLAKLLNVNTQIVSTDTAPKKINVGFGVELFATDRTFDRVLNDTAEATPIIFNLKSPGQVTVKLFDGRGREVTTIFDGQKAAGKHTVTFDSRNLRGSQYFYQLFIDGQSRTARMLLLSR